MQLYDNLSSRQLNELRIYVMYLQHNILLAGSPPTISAEYQPCEFWVVLFIYLFTSQMATEDICLDWFC